MSRDIKNIRDLRDHALDTLRRLEKREIELNEADAYGKVYSSVMGSLKLEMDYNKALGQAPLIPFLNVSNTYENALDDDSKSRLRISHDDD